MTDPNPTDHNLTDPDPTNPQPLACPRVRVFEMVRHEDVTGFSGVGVVADGIEFPDGSVAFRWRGPYASTVVFEAGTDAVVAVHGHRGATVIRWVAVVPDDRRQPEGAREPPRSRLASHLAP